MKVASGRAGMEGLQRSEVSFRRQGSSGLVWDDKFLSGELKKISTKAEDTTTKESKPSYHQQHDGAAAAAYRTVNVEPAAEPPSPRVSGCGVCGVFGKKPAAKSQKRKHAAGHRKS